MKLKLWAFAFCCLTGSGLPGTAAAADREWDAGATFGFDWTNRFNWKDNIAPVAGDRLIFPGMLLVGLGMTTHNDFPPGTVFGGLRIFSEAPEFSSEGYTITGNPIVLNAPPSSNNPFDSSLFIESDGTNAVIPPVTFLNLGITLADEARFVAFGRVNLQGRVNLAGHPLSLNIGTHIEEQREWDCTGGFEGAGELTINGRTRLYSNADLTATVLVQAGPALVTHALSLGSPAQPTEMRFGTNGIFLTGGIIRETGSNGLEVYVPQLDEPVFSTAGRIVAAGTATTVLRGGVETELLTQSVPMGGSQFANLPSYTILEARAAGLTVQGGVQGTGRVYVTGPHPVRFTGTAPSPLMALTQVGSNGVLELDTAGASLGGPLQVTDGGTLRTLRSGQLLPEQIQLTGSAEWELGGHSAEAARLILEGGTVTGGGTLRVTDYLDASSSIIDSTGFTPAISANVVLTGQAAEFQLKKRQGFFFLTGNLTADAGSGVTSLRMVQQESAPAGTVVWTGTSNLPLMQVEGCKLRYTGASTGLDLRLSGGAFEGSSATVRDVTDLDGSSVSADDGSLAVRHLVLKATSKLIREVSEATGNESISASGNVQLGGAVLELRTFNSPEPTLGARRIIVQKNSPGPVSGTFRRPPEDGGAPLDEGSLLEHEGFTWRLSYAGLDGNDVTLTLASVEPTGVTMQWSGNAGVNSWTTVNNWSPPGIPDPGDSLLFAAATDKFPFNDTAAETIYQQLRVQSDGYTLRGNSVGLMGGMEVNFPTGQLEVEHGVRLGANQSFNVRQSARLRLGAVPSARVDLNGFSLSLNTATATAALDIGEAAAGNDPPSAFTGSGSISKLGPGVLNIAAPSDFAGPFTVHGGTVRLTRSLAALGAASASSGTELRKDSGALLEIATAAGTVAEPFTIGLGSTLRSHPGSGVMNLTGAVHSFGTIEAASGELHVSGPVTGVLTKTGAAPWQINGGAAFAPSSVNHTAGQMSFLLSAGTNWPGELNASASTTVRLLAADQLGGPVTLGADALLNLNGFNETLPSLNLLDADVTTGAGILTCPSLSTSGLLGCSISGKLAIPAGGMVLDVVNDDAATDLTISAVVSGAALTKNGEGTALLSGNNTFTSAAINEGAIYFTGVNTAPVTLNGGMIGGGGSVGTLTSGAAGGLVSPGMTTGILSCGSVTGNPRTTFAVELNNPTPGTGHDQINVTGSVNLGGAQLVALPGSSAAGTMTIIANDGTDAVTGTFAGLPENATFAVAGKTFRISYTGGTGNDVTLTVIVTGTGVTKTWSGLGANNQWPTPANWVGGVAPVPGDDLVFPAGPFVKICNNTFPSGTTFNSIRITDSGYGLAGNAISLNAGIVFDYATNVSSVAMDVTLAGPWSVTVLQGAQAVIVPNTALATAGFPLTAQVDGAAARLTLNLLSGAGALVKTGIGGLTMNVNNWTGPVTLSGGETKTGTLSGFGTGTSAIAVQSGAELRFENIAGGTFTRPLSLSGKLEFSASPITLSGAISLPSSGQRTVEVTGGTPALTGVISGSGGLRKTGAGLLTVSGAGSNTFAGGCTVAESTLRLGKSGIALPGPVTIGDGAGSDVLFYLAANQISDAATVDLLGSGAVMQCGTFSDIIGALRFTGGTVSGSSTLSVGEHLRSFAATTTATVDISFMPLASPFMVDVEDGAAALDLTISGDWLGAAALDADRTGDGTFSLRSGTMRTLRLCEGTTLVTGLFSPAAILLAGGILGGDGITTEVSTESGKKGGISPGASPGQLTVSTWTGDENSELTMEIGGTTPGTQHDKLIVGGMADPKETVLTLVPLAGYTPQPGQSFTLIQNNGPDRMASEFFKLLEGATFDFAGATARITYSGGDGNDVAIAILYITDTGVTRVWDGGGANGNWTTPENWDDDTAPVPGDSLSFPSAAARKTNTNNFPAGSNFHRIGIGDAYTISGNLIALNDGVHRQDGTSANVTTITAPLIATRAQTFSNAVPPPSPSATTILVVESLNTAGFPITMDTRSHADISLNNVSGTGSLAVTGSGRLLPAVITMTGALSIQGTSIVLLNGSLGSISSVSIASGAILGVSPFSPVTITQPISLSGVIAATDTTFTGTITLPTGAKGRFNANAGETTTISGRIQGAGKLATMGDGTIRFTGAVANTFTGGLEHGGALLMLSKSAGVTALPGLVEGTGNGEIRWLGANQAADSAVFTRVRTLNLNNSSDTFARLVLGNTDVTTGAGTLTLTGDISSQFAAADTATISGKLAFTGAGPHLLELSDTTAAAELTCSAVITTGPGVLLRKTGTGTATFTGANATAVEIAAGKVNWNGNAPATSITLTGGTLNGTGTTGPVSAGGGGTVSPGLSPGQLHTGNLTWDSTLTYAPELLTTIAGSGHDQLLATGTVSLGGAILATSLLPGFAATPGDAFLLIVNDGIDSVSGTFSDLPEGAHFFSDAHLFRISYTGGDGNDVVLTKVEETEPGITAHSFVPGVGAEAGQTVLNVTATGLTGLNYVMESSTDLETWNPLQSLPASPGGTITFRALKPDTFPRLFLRVSRE